MYVKECDVAWGSHANVYSEKEYTYMTTDVTTSVKGCVHIRDENHAT